MGVLRSRRSQGLRHHLVTEQGLQRGLRIFIPITFIGTVGTAGPRTAVREPPERRTLVLRVLGQDGQGPDCEFAETASRGLSDPGHGLWELLAKTTAGPRHWQERVD